MKLHPSAVSALNDGLALLAVRSCCGMRTMASVSIDTRNVARSISSTVSIFTHDIRNAARSGAEIWPIACASCTRPFALPRDSFGTSCVVAAVYAVRRKNANTAPTASAM